MSVLPYLETTPMCVSLNRLCVLPSKSICLDLPRFIFDLVCPAWLGICLPLGGCRRALEILDQAWFLGPPTCSLKTPWVSASIKPASQSWRTLLGCLCPQAELWGISEMHPGCLGPVPPGVQSLMAFLFCLFRAALAAYGGSQARGPVGAAAAGLWDSRSNSESKPHLQPRLHLAAARDP